MVYENKFTTDWLGSKPVFYNVKTGIISHNFDDVIDFENFEFDPEGFNNYLDFGYSVFEQTPVKDVKFLRHSSEIYKDANGIIHIKHTDDPVFKLINKISKTEDVLKQIEKSVQFWEKTFSGEIIIPTSGGYDSRLLNLNIKDKNRIRSFTYGVSSQQNESSEVVYAKKLSNLLGTQWEHIELENFNENINEWNNIFGAFVHAHGMYHIEFYKKILNKVGTDKYLLSGIIGDAWAGSVNIDPIKSINELSRLGYSHGLHADSKFSLLKSPNTLKKNYFEKNKEKLLDEKWLVIEAMRFKMILLHYLMKVPESLGFKPWSPFLEIDIAIAMLNLPKSERKNRLWQKRYFEKHGVSLESLKIKKDDNNTLNLDHIQKTNFDLLDTKLFEGLIKTEYIDSINKTLSQSKLTLSIKKILHNILKRLYFIPKLQSLLQHMKIDDYNLSSKENRAYAAYLTLKPIEKLIKKRNARK